MRLFRLTSTGLSLINLLWTSLTAFLAFDISSIFSEIEKVQYSRSHAYMTRTDENKAFVIDSTCFDRRKCSSMKFCLFSKS